MPTYVFRCPEGHTQEDFLSMPGPKHQTCRICGKRATKKTGPGSCIIFKGGGWCKPGR